MSALTEAIKIQDKRVALFIAAGVALVILAVIAIPNLLRTHMSAYEATTAHKERLHAISTLEEKAVNSVAPVAAPSAEGDAVAQFAGTPPPAAVVDRKLVRTASLELTVKSPADAAEQILRMAESMGGYLESAQIGGTKDAPTADITIRVPAARFEDAKAQIRTLAARVESEKTDAQDVTRQYVDMGARLRNLRAEESQYLAILKSAYKVEDLVQVTEKLSEVRGEIEQQQAEFQTLSKQVETVAVTISLRAFADAQVFGLNWRPLYQLKLGLRNGLEALGDYAAAMVAIVFYVPVILAWGLTILLAAVVAWRLFRWTASRFFASPRVETAAKPVA